MILTNYMCEYVTCYHVNELTDLVAHTDGFLSYLI